MNDDRLTQLETEMAALTARVALLESGTDETTRPLPADNIPPGGIDFRLMERLQNRRGGIFDGDGVGGAIIYAGDFRNEHGKCVWHVERAVPFLAGYAAGPLATLLTALGHPQRLALVQLLLRGPHDRQQLQEALDIASPGQLYHHLHSLMDAGVITQHRRGIYAVAPKTIIPLLIIMAAAVDITEDSNDHIEEENE